MFRSGCITILILVLLGFSLGQKSGSKLRMSVQQQAAVTNKTNLVADKPFEQQIPYNNYCSCSREACVQNHPRNQRKVFDQSKLDQSVRNHIRCTSQAPY